MENFCHLDQDRRKDDRENITVMRTKSHSTSNDGRMGGNGETSVAWKYFRVIDCRKYIQRTRSAILEQRDEKKGVGRR